MKYQTFTEMLICRTFRAHECSSVNNIENLFEDMLIGLKINVDGKGVIACLFVKNEYVNIYAFVSIFMKQRAADISRPSYFLLCLFVIYVCLCLNICSRK